MNTLVTLKTSNNPKERLQPVANNSNNESVKSKFFANYFD